MASVYFYIYTLYIQSYILLYTIAQYAEYYGTVCGILWHSTRNTMARYAEYYGTVRGILWHSTRNTMAQYADALPYRWSFGFILPIIYSLIYNFYDIHQYIVITKSFVRGQEGEDHARREVFPLLTPLSLGFVSASGVK